MILFLVSFYAFRKNFFVAYGLLIHLVAYYIQLALTVKMVYGVASGTNFAKEYASQHSDTPLVIFCSIIFGVKRIESDGSYYEDNFRMFIYYFTLIACIILS